MIRMAPITHPTTMAAMAPSERSSSESVSVSTHPAVYVGAAVVRVYPVSHATATQVPATSTLWDTGEVDTHVSAELRVTAVEVRVPAMAVPTSAASVAVDIASAREAMSPSWTFPLTMALVEPHENTVERVTGLVRAAPVSDTVVEMVRASDSVVKKVSHAKSNDMTKRVLAVSLALVVPRQKSEVSVDSVHSQAPEVQEEVRSEYWRQSASSLQVVTLLAMTVCTRAANRATRAIDMMKVGGWMRVS